MKESDLDDKMMIRSYKPADLEACRLLWVALTQWHREIYDSPAIGGDNPGLYFDEHLVRVGPENIWVAEINGRIIGLTGLIVAAEEAELEPLVVLSEYRGRGVGRMLAETVLQQARSSGARQLKVRPVGRNEAAIRFFHKLGFNIIGQIELFQELGPGKEDIWEEREAIAGRNFKV